MPRIRTRDAMLVALGALAVVLLTGVPLGALVPLVAVGACLLMHVVMMGHMGHGGHAGHDHTPQPAAEPEPPERLGSSREPVR